jgi:hypothetical protein
MLFRYCEGSVPAWEYVEDVDVAAAQEDSCSERSEYSESEQSDSEYSKRHARKFYEEDRIIWIDGRAYHASTFNPSKYPSL